MRSKSLGMAGGFFLGVGLALGAFSPSASGQTYLFDKANFSTGTGPVSVAAGDFNGDGKLDLAVANSNCPAIPCSLSPGSVSILLGNVGGTFQSHVDYAVGNRPLSVVTADFNGDGRLDLAVVNFDDNTVSILLGKGDGTFQAHVDYPTGKSPISVTVGDFNGDGKLDLAVANRGSNTVSILLGKGDGTFQPNVDYTNGQLACLGGHGRF